MIKIPFSAPLPVPTITEVGVAKPKAQGQAIIRTPTVVIKAREILPITINQSTKVAMAIAITTGTNQPVTWSANLWMGAFEPWAS